VEQFVSTIALIGIVIVVASLLSSAIEKASIPLVAAFLALGAALGPWGLDLINITLASPSLAVLSTLALALVLFSDAVTINARDVWARRRLAWRLLGPGTVAPAALIAVAARFILDLPTAYAAILGAALASTDPVLLRSVFRSKALPSGSRIALRMETGMNDVVLLPIVVLCMLLLESDMPGHTLSAADMSRHAVGLFLLGPGLGALIGWLGILALARVRQRIGLRRDYESLYALGLAFTSYAAAETVGGSGFLAAFAAGFMVALQDVELCDCFLEFGEATGEMLLLLTFVALGTSLIWEGLGALSLRTLAFTVVALLARTVVLFPVLKHVGLDQRDRRLIALFGPRGLSSLLLVLLPIFAGIPNAEQLFTVASLVVLCSVVLHGGGIAYFLRRAERQAAAASVRPAAPTHAPLPILDGDDVPETIEIPELKALLASGQSPVLLDVRRDRNLRADPEQAAKAVRLDLDDPVRSALREAVPKDAIVIAYCACPAEETSSRVVHALRRAGWTKARALVGGWAAWKAAGLPIESSAEAVGI